jgi:hypothetical protein
LLPRRLLLSASLLATACASAPAPLVNVAPAPAPAVRRLAAPGPLPVSLICNAAAAQVSFRTIGVPDGERPLDVAVANGHIYVLFEPARLLRLTPDEGGKVQTVMQVGRPDERWKAMDVDPTDGSVWLASEKFVLLRISPDQRVTRVPLQRVAGSGGFHRLLVGSDAIYASPVCAEDGVWRIDRAGKVLSSAFPAPPRQQGEPLEPGVTACSPVVLERDRDGHILAWDTRSGAVRQADGRGEWSAGDPAPFSSLPNLRMVKGFDVGGRNEQWYLAGGARRLFYWKGKPVFLGPATFHPGSKANDTVLVVPQAGGARDLVESCHGAVIWGIATSATEYAAFTTQAVVFGTFATAPDLP